MVKNYIFTLRRIPDRNNLLICTLELDSFLQIPSQDELMYAQLVDDLNEIKAYNSIVWAIKMRSRFNTDILPNFFKVTFNGELDRDDFQLYINALNQDTLNKFLKEATIRV